MTPRERVLATLRGEKTDKIPFTIYESMIPQCAVERRLRNGGLCIVNRRVPAVNTERPNCTERIIRHPDPETGKQLTRVEITTPAGVLTQVKEPADFTSWTREHLFKGPEDYAALRAFVADEVYTPNYDEFARAEAWMGEDVILRAGAGGNPLHRIMIGWMNIETFSVEWAERRDEVLALEKVMADKARERFPLVAASPATHANFGGNEVPEVMGPQRYEEFCLPLVKECAEVLGAKGKFAGSHMDGNNRPWAHLLARSGLHYVEAFTPEPGTDMSVAEALEAWPDKVLWSNFPSATHLAPLDEVKRIARDQIEQARSFDGPNRLIIGITEDIPKDRWQESLQAISEVINES